MTNPNSSTSRAPRGVVGVRRRSVANAPAGLQPRLVVTRSPFVHRPVAAPAPRG